MRRARLLALLALLPTLLAVERPRGLGDVTEVRPGIRCPTGEARITPGFDLPARWVIHTVGPVYESDDLSAPLLEAAHRSSLELAREHELTSVAFPAISCGIFGYPVEEAAPIAIRVAQAFAPAFEEVRFVLFGRSTYAAWLDATRAALPR